MSDSTIEANRSPFQLRWARCYILNEEREKLSEQETLMSKFVFLAGIFTSGQIKFINENSKGVVQNAADSLQKAIIRGLVENGVTNLEVVNLPFIGSYPKGFSRTNFPATNEIMDDNVAVHGQSFSLLRIIKSFSRGYASYMGLCRASRDQEPFVLIYSAHLPFLLAALLHRSLRGGGKVFLILPDLPEFMGVGGWKYTLAKAIESRIFYRLCRYIDGFVLLTSAMAKRLNLDADKFVVVEGIATFLDLAPLPTSKKRVFLYSGTLAERYGILDLVYNFQQVKASDIELWICGEGDTRDKVIAATREDSRIKYLGQLSRSEVLELQTKASVLVNPRRPTGEFTLYSFPSKTMEYMASGRPVMMHRLPAMPDEYLPHFFDPGESPDGIKLCIERLATMDASALDEAGATARHFVLSQKDAKTQCRKILSLVTAKPEA